LHHLLRRHGPHRFDALVRTPRNVEHPPEHRPGRVICEEPQRPLKKPGTQCWRATELRWLRRGTRAHRLADGRTSSSEARVAVATFLEGQHDTVWRHGPTGAPRSFHPALSAHRQNFERPAPAL
jgi:hypothetical protein